MRFSVFIFCLLHAPAFAQEPGDNFSLIVEDLAGLSDEDADFETRYEGLMQKFTHPVDLNEASPDELRSLSLFSENQLQSILRYRDLHGPLLSIYELQGLPEMDLTLLRRISSRVTVRDPKALLNSSLLKRAWMNDLRYLIVRCERNLEVVSGFSDPDSSKRYLGPGEKWYLRFRNSLPGDFSLGFTAEQDAGEPFRWNIKKRQYGFDFTSAHLQVLNKGVLKNLVVGDFQAQFGQGLLFGGGFGSVKGGEMIASVRRANTGFTPYTSAGETGFFRGMGGTFALTGTLSASVICSRVRQDGALDEQITLQQTGFHRNAAELLARKQIAENNYGAGVHFTRADFEIGALWNHTTFSNKLNPELSPYNQFAFRGNTLTTTSLYFSYNRYNAAFFGEAGHNIGAGFGLVGGTVVALTSSFNTSLVYRAYTPNFHSPYGSSLAESSRLQNERGIYWGSQYQLSRHISVTAYVDLFRFPWLGFRRYAPSSGHEWRVRLNWQHNRSTKLSVQIRQEKKERNASHNERVYELVPVMKRNVGLSLSVEANRNLRLQTRLHLNTFSESNVVSSGILIAQDATASAGKFRITARYALVDIENFENRQYIYENDAWMTFSMPAYFGIGVKTYVLIQWKPHKGLTLWCRYSRHRFIDRESIGAGTDAIQGPVKNHIKLQAMLRF